VTDHPHHKAPLTAVYPGTFDPMTLGHEDLMRRASRLFDRLVLAVAAGHHKRTMFTIAERLDMAREIARPYPNIEVMAFRGLLSQFVGEVDGITYINDSKSTNLDALAQALQGQSGGVVLIAGGKNKGFDFAPLTDLVGARAHDAVLIGELRGSIARGWSGSVPCHPVDSLGAALDQARSLARPGDTVLFSPGTSSFDMFRSYEERGDTFKQLVRQIQPTNYTS
jgi:cytidyltransferase-like protein